MIEEKNSKSQEIATKEDYLSTFSRGSGEKVLTDLLARFYDRQPYFPGGVEGQRETERRAAQAEVVRHILIKLGQVDGG